VFKHTKGCCSDKSKIKCLACEAGKKVKEYCEENPKTKGCSKKMCCKSNHVDCLACRSDNLPKFLCRLRPKLEGCDLPENKISAEEKLCKCKPTSTSVK